MKKSMIFMILAAMSLLFHPYAFADPSIVIEKATNGDDADTAPGPAIEVGQTVSWTYEVTNTGDETLENITVTDDQGVPVDCYGVTTLAPGGSTTCDANGIAVFGQYGNIGTVSATSSGDTYSDEDPSHYFGILDTAGIDIEKFTNGEDADTIPGPIIPHFSSVTWTYAVTNIGNVELMNIAVTDDQGVIVTCPQTELSPGESMECTGRGVAELGQYSNVGTVTASDDGNSEVNDSDPSHYYGSSRAGDIGENVTVGIKIGEGTDKPAPINLGANGVVPVTVYSNEEFNAGTIDPATVYFAGASPSHWTLKGNQDMKFHFQIQSLELTEDSTEATLIGETIDGTVFAGTDAIRIIPSNPKKPPKKKPPKPNPKKPPKKKPPKKPKK